MQGTTISHYHILHELGAGGMGVVWKAEDIRLGRMVALKFLPSSGTNDKNDALRQRLIREARAAASLDHPNICTVHEIDETADGQTLMAMAYYEGETLAARIKRGRFDLPGAVHIVSQILSGLAHAHEMGVIHRDIKPANVMINKRGEVKIVDFGLAKFTGSSDGLTASGSVVGTVSYLAPELLLGHQADARADLWSTGVVLYEMLVGAPPFNGPTAYAVLHAITHEEPRPVIEIRPDLPAIFDGVMRRALARDRSHRFVSAVEFNESLEASAGIVSSNPALQTTATIRIDLPLRTGVVDAERSVLVLPIVNVGGNAEWDYFSDGLTDEIITDLSNIHSLRVICSTSAMRLKGTTTDLKQIARELNVQYILEGAVRIAGNTLRLTAKLINPINDKLEWGEKYSGSLQDVFEIQENLSRKIVAALKLKLTPVEESRLAEHPIHDIRAYEYYLKAKHEILSYSKEGLERALDYLKTGQEIIGENIMLLSAMGQVYWQFVNAGISADPEYLQKARTCADRVLELEPGSSHGNRLLGMIYILQGKPQEAVSRLKAALAVDPNDPDTISWYCALCALSGKPDQVKSMVKRLLAIDPLTPVYQFLPGLLALMAGDFANALEPFDKALVVDPANPILRMVRGHVLALNGRLAEATSAWDDLASDTPDNFFAELGQLYKHALSGDKAAALAAVTDNVTTNAAGDPQYAWNVAECYALIEEPQEAIRWVGIAVGNGFINYPLLNELDPLLASIRAQPEFVSLMQTVQERWARFHV